DFQGCLDDEEDTRSNQQYLNELEEEYQERALLAKSKRFFKKGLKGLVAEAYEWDEEDVSSDDNEMIEVKVLMALVDDENVAVGKERERAINGLVAEAYEWDEEDVSSDD
nr:retrovirus-related Pol polyprotein from transposon TNT 1-94 [Tanacetum cinerariifolium]